MPVCVGGEGKIAQNGTIGGVLSPFQDKNGRFERIDAEKTIWLKESGVDVAKSGLSCKNGSNIGIFIVLCLA